ncbi:hypothetical protein [Janthinobacterium sp. RB2P8]|uniref:hypothetical protein n=1 Tax=Janthinobacterium sp. RB2P8 TaxID=3424191 RepID=UPI003F2427BC
MMLTDKNKWLKAVAGVLLSLLVGVIFLLSLDRLTNWLYISFNLSQYAVSYTIAGGLFCFLAGYFGYRFREKQRLWYASVEIGVAMLTAGATVYNALTTDQSSWGSLLAFSGAIYIAVRGFDNLAKIKKI